jgi:hypothetical protein|tara:strand:+ start:120 stop:464 length:345 start_codon:yes stop_codon:yes gene_type:complete
MCFGGSVPRMKEPESEYQNRPVTVTGKQKGVANPKDTRKATERLKIKRQKEEGTYVDPNLTTTEKLTKKSGGGNLTKQQQKNRDANRQKAKDMARARLGKKFGSSPTGRQTGVS